jgi:hypothetical protein
MKDICIFRSDDYAHYEHYCKLKTKPIVLFECEKCGYFM